MNSKFFDLKKEKQDRMINAALKIFALQGYRHASTDDIVKEASISKGLLFHYFGSKQGLYRFVYDYSTKFMNLELRTCVNGSETNLLELEKQIEFAKMHILKGYPYMQQFLNRAAVEDCPEAAEFVAEKKNTLEETYRTIYSQVNVSRFPQGVDPEKFRKMVELTIKGLMSERLQDVSFDPEAMYEEICDYLNMMKGLLA